MDVLFPTFVSVFVELCSSFLVKTPYRYNNILRSATNDLYMCGCGFVSLDRSPSFICGFVQFPMGAILIYIITFIFIHVIVIIIYCAATFIRPVGSFSLVWKTSNWILFFSLLLWSFFYFLMEYCFVCVCADVGYNRTSHWQKSRHPANE